MRSTIMILTVVAAFILITTAFSVYSPATATDGTALSRCCPAPEQAPSNPCDKAVGVSQGCSVEQAQCCSCDDCTCVKCCSGDEKCTCDGCECDCCKAKTCGKSCK